MASFGIGCKTFPTLMLRAACRSQLRGCALLPPVYREVATPKSLAARSRARQRFAQSTHSQCFYAPKDTDTAHLAELLSRERLAGDCICLHGAVGTGKSVFSRAYIRAIEGDDQLPVPSPTYLLQNIYDFEEGPPVHHFDLYRLSGGADLHRLDLSQSLTHATSLFEWADRLQSALPPVRLDVHLHALGPDQESALQAHVGCLDFGSGDESEVEDQYVDKRSRLICLEARGPRWEEQLADIVQTLSSGSPQSGLQAIPDMVLSKVQQTKPSGLFN